MKIILIVAMSLFLFSCASILNDKTQNINVVTSNNSEVQGTIAGLPFAAPGIVTTTRSKADKILLVSSPGCTKQTLLPSEVDTKFFINILSGGTFGSSTDYGTEKMWKFQDTVTIICR